jgi:hypothetical protein
MSRFSTASREAAGQVLVLTRQGISLNVFLSNTSCCQVSNSQLLLHVAMQMGLYLHRLITDVWRVVSGDSDLRSDQSFLLIDCTDGLSLQMQYHRILSYSSI